jgi:ribose 5-phosphate isomerase A
LGIPIGPLVDHPEIDLTIDGANEVETDLNLIKGGGGASLREKIWAQNSCCFVNMVDENKLSVSLGVKKVVLVEVVSFGSYPFLKYVKTLSARCETLIKRKKRTF